MAAAKQHRLRRILDAVRYTNRSSANGPFFLSKLFLTPATSPTAATPPVRARTLPELPSEIWLLIIRNATTPTAPSTWADDPKTVSFLSLPYIAPRLSTHRSMMSQKALLTLVCKAWHSYLQEFLFEFVWISRERQASLLASLLRKEAPCQRGRYIRRLHVETPMLERCNAADLRTILDHAPGLTVYSDYRSVRRRNVLDAPQCSSATSTFSPHTDPASPDSLLDALARPGNSLRRLSWTNYDDASFHLRLSPLLLATANNLEYLELNFCSQLHLHNYDPALAPDARSYTAPLTLPSLSSLKVTLDNGTFAVLAEWNMPRLRNLSVLAADFSYYSEHGVGIADGEHVPSGFEQFFYMHGTKVEQLELGHSTAVIEEHWVTTPPRRSSTTGPNPGRGRIPLSAWCPNLHTFICSADAEWNWQSPDWIAPHVLLPAHPGVRLIGVRDIGKRVAAGVRADGRDFFVLGEQMGSLLRRAAFPALLYIRDMSYESELLRRGDGECAVSEVGAALAAGPSDGCRRWPWEKAVAGLDPHQVRSSRQIKDQLRVLRFWEEVLDRCRAAGVWLENWRGVNVTAGDLRRAEASLLGAWMDA